MPTLIFFRVGACPPCSPRAGAHEFGQIELRALAVGVKVVFVSFTSGMLRSGKLLVEYIIRIHCHRNNETCQKLHPSKNHYWLWCPMRYKCRSL